MPPRRGHRAQSPPGPESPFTALDGPSGSAFAFPGLFLPSSLLTYLQKSSVPTAARSGSVQGTSLRPDGFRVPRVNTSRARHRGARAARAPARGLRRTRGGGQRSAGVAPYGGSVDGRDGAEVATVRREVGVPLDVAASAAHPYRKASCLQNDDDDRSIHRHTYRRWSSTRRDISHSCTVHTTVTVTPGARRDRPSRRGRSGASPDAGLWASPENPRRRVAFTTAAVPVPSPERRGSRLWFCPTAWARVPSPSGVAGLCSPCACEHSSDPPASGGGSPGTTPGSRRPSPSRARGCPSRPGRGRDRWTDETGARRPSRPSVDGPEGPGAGATTEGDLTAGVTRDREPALSQGVGDPGRTRVRASRAVTRDREPSRAPWGDPGQLPLARPGGDPGRPTPRRRGPRPVSRSFLDAVPHRRGSFGGPPSAVAARHGVTRARGPPCLLYTSPSPRDGLLSRMPSSA